MKNIYKKIIIMFVMAWAIVFGSFSTAFADDANQSIKINNTTLNFNRIIYVDGTNGDDSIGYGTENKPYKSLEKAETIVNSGDAIVFKGNFTADKKIFKSGISYIGFGLDSIINTSEIQGNNVNLYRFVIDCKHANEMYSISGKNFNLYNIVYTNQYSSDSSIELFYNYTGIVRNCMFGPGNWNSFISYSTVDYKNTACTNDAFDLKYIKKDNNYNITSSGWKNTGVGTNPDGTQANIGVYGGEFAWGNWSSEEKSISLDKSSLSLKENTSSKLTATTTPAGAEITWKSSDDTVATVDSNGNVKAIKEGQSTITAQIKDTDINATYVVTVTKEEPPVDPEDPTNPDQEYIINTAYAKGDNTNNASGQVTIIFKGNAEAQLKVIKTADVDSVYVGDHFTYTIEVTNTSDKVAKSVVIKDSAPNHIQFITNEVTATQGKVDSSSTDKNIVVNVGDIQPLGKVTIKIPVLVVE